MLMSRCPSHSFREGSPALVGSGRKQAGRTAIATVLALLISLANPYDTCENRWEAQNGMSKEFAKISNYFRIEFYCFHAFRVVALQLW